VKISEFVKTLNKIKRKVGDVEVVYDARTVGYQDEHELKDLDVLGVFLMRTEGENRAKRALWLGDTSTTEIDELEFPKKDYLET
jgi:hypothetical protein